MARRGLYVEGLQTSIRTNATAYGYSIMITSSFGVTSILSSKPGAGEIFLFALGAVAGFAAVQLAATGALRADEVGRDRTRVLLIAALLSIVSVEGGVGAAALVAWLGAGWYVWLVAPFAASAGFLLVNGAEFALAEQEESA